MHSKRTEVEIATTADLQYWCAEFRCSQKDLAEALSKVGNSASVVDAYLTMNQKKGERHMRNRNARGLLFEAELVQKVWEKAAEAEGFDPRLIRKDHCGALIKRDMFGNTNEYLSMGWEIDHIKPITKGGKDNLANLQPLQWQNNFVKAENHPYWDSLVSAGKTNTNTYVK